MTIIEFQFADHLHKQMVDWLRNELARWTYRPGWTLKIETVHGLFTALEIARLIVRYPAPDSRNPDQTRQFTVHMSIPSTIAEERDSDVFAAWLQQALWEIERHESQEWLRRDGQLYDDPHAIRL